MHLILLETPADVVSDAWFLNINIVPTIKIDDFGVFSLLTLEQYILQLSQLDWWLCIPSPFIIVHSCVPLLNVDNQEYHQFFIGIYIYWNLTSSNFEWHLAFLPQNNLHLGFIDETHKFVAFYGKFI